MPDNQFRFRLTPTQEKYALSEAVVNIIFSNTGEGKTFASVAAMMAHAVRCGKPIRCAIVRDTHENIKTSTARSIMDVFENTPNFYRFRDNFKQLTIFSNPAVHVDLFGIDDLGSLSKLQGPEYALIWLEEPAPMADKVNAGLAEEVFSAALVRATRQKGTESRVQVSMNPADEDHWTYRRFIEDPMIDPETPLITRAVFRIPPGENIHVSETSRQAVRAAYRDDPASYSRYVLGEFAAVYRGVRVTPQYNRRRHLAMDANGERIRLTPAAGLVGFAFFDSWSNPSCTLGQITQYNRLIFIDTVRLESSDIGALLDLQVVPLLESPKWKNKCRAWRIGGDCTMMNMDQSNRLMSASRVVEKYFPGSNFEPGPREWRAIEQHVKQVLRQSDFRGEPMVYLSGDNRLLDKGLSGGWHYPTNNSGEKTGKVPVKDEISHPCDAWANATCVLLPSNISTRPRLPRAAAAKRRARSYATP